MSDETLDANCAAMMRKSLEAGIGALQETSRRQDAVTHGTIGVVLQAALAALPQREGAPAAKPNPACKRWVCQLHGHYSCGCEKRWLCECGKAASEHPAAPHEGEPGVSANVTSWIRYARHQRERAVRAEADAAKDRELHVAIRAESVERREKLEVAEAELATLREQEPVVRIAAEKTGGTSLDWLGEKPFMSCDLSGGPLTHAMRRILGPLDERFLYAAPVPPADYAQALREARAQVWREAAEMAEGYTFCPEGVIRTMRAKAREAANGERP